jgi:hypothetical protein
MNMPAFSAEIAEAHIKASKPFACGSLGLSVLRACSGIASPFLPEQLLYAERRLPGRYTMKDPEAI